MNAKQKVSLNVNGVDYEREIEPRTLLSDFLRHDLDLTGTHVGCEHGICGSCTILLDGLPVRSCLTFAVQAEGRPVETVESLDSNGELSPLQNAFWENQGLQCGFCTPGILMSMKAYLIENPEPTRDEIRHALSGNLCRCTGYHDIVDSVVAAAEAALSSAKTAAGESR
ncbi:MAG: carbon-monoxide dehydrogenase small subunit [Gammaproteobacteria bacterium]|jgi:aerobic-type carbon monoxide dehydrogenase small subunit (CoxS/CutS family)